MRIRPVVTTILAALMVVMGIDYVTYAATGDGLVLGRTNRADRATLLVRTTPGPALKLRSRPGSPPFAVNSGAKVAQLNADRLDGLDSAMLLGRVSAFQPSACTSRTPVPQSFVKLTDLGEFSVRPATRYTRIEYATTFSGEPGAANALVFQLRVDDEPTTLGLASRLLRDFGTLGYDELTGVFEGLTPGGHVLSVWTRATGGDATRARLDSGCFNSAGVNNVYVTEFR